MHSFLEQMTFECRYLTH